MKRTVKKLKAMLGSRAATFATGILVGAAIFGGGVAIAAGITAVETSSAVYVDGKPVEFEAYNIHDNNFFKLRDIGEALGFSVVWDGTNNRILIDTSRGYDVNERYVLQGEATVGASVKDRLTIEAIGTTKMLEVTVVGDAIPGKLANGADITEANILAMLAELEAIFPQDTSWGDGSNGQYYHCSAGVTSGGGCNAWAAMTASLLWGNGAKFTSHSDLSKVKCGDVVRLYNEATGREHWIVAMNRGESVTGASLFFTSEGNVNGKVSWDDRYIKNTSSDYPDCVIYNFY